jgi:rhodanese-related sulfurtransferase/rubrerythrin
MKTSSLTGRIPTLSVDEVRAYLAEHDPGAYNLLDVRQPEEYAKGHLPGSQLIPVGELRRRIDEIDRTRPTVVYCRSGVRSANGVGVLLNAGFDEVWNMAGGMLGWEGKVATGAPEAGMWWFEKARGPEENIALAWILEEGARLFYARMADQLASLGAGDLFKGLTAAEEGHKETLRKLYGVLTGREGDPLSPDEVAAHDTMEGGVSITKALAWADGKKPVDVLEFSVAMEVNAYDLYLKVAQGLDDRKSKDILLRIAREEKAHLDRLMELFVQQADLS